MAIASGAPPHEWEAGDALTIWDLLQEHIERCMTPNDIACNVRLVNKAAAKRFCGAKHTTIHLSQPCPHPYFKRYWGDYDLEAVNARSFRQRLHLVCLTAASGVIDNLAVALKVSNCIVTGEMMEAAAAAGQLDSCRWLWARECPWGKALVSAGLGGHRAVFEYMLVMGCPCTEDALYAAARSGNMDLITWLGLDRQLREDTWLRLDRHPREEPLSIEKLLMGAAEGCDAANFRDLMLKWLGSERALAQRLKSNSFAQVLDAAAASPRPDWRAKVEWLESLGFRRSPTTPVAAAAVYPDGAERLKWMLQRGYPLRSQSFDREFFRAAGGAGNLAVVQFLLTDSQGLSSQDIYPAATAAAEGAAEAGRLDFLVALHDQTFKLDAEAQGIVHHGARGGHLPVVKWAAEELEYDIGADLDLLPVAAESGNVELLKWIWVSNPHQAPLSMAAAASSGCIRALEWMMLCGLHTVGEPRTWYAQAARNGDMATLLWLTKRLGGPPPMGLLAECVRTNCPPQITRWLVEDLGCRVDSWSAAGIDPESPGARGWLARTFGRLSTLSNSSSAAGSRNNEWLQQVLDAIHLQRAGMNGAAGAAGSNLRGSGVGGGSGRGGDDVVGAGRLAHAGGGGSMTGAAGGLRFELPTARSVGVEVAAQVQGSGSGSAFWGASSSCSRDKDGASSGSLLRTTGGRHKDP